MLFFGALVAQSKHFLHKVAHTLKSLGTEHWGSVKYQAVEFEDFPLFCGDVVSIYGGKYIFLCSRRIEHENDALMYFLTQDAVTVDPFDNTKAPQNFDDGEYLAIKASDLDVTMMSVTVERYMLQEYDQYYENMAHLMILMMRYDSENITEPVPEVQKLPSSIVSTEGI